MNRKNWIFIILCIAQFKFANAKVECVNHEMLIKGETVSLSEVERLRDENCVNNSQIIVFATDKFSFDCTIALKSDLIVIAPHWNSINRVEYIPSLSNLNEYEFMGIYSNVEKLDTGFWMSTNDSKGKK